MSRRLGMILHWLGLLAAIVAVGGAIAWNAQTLQGRRTAQENLRTLSPAVRNYDEALAAAYARQRASTANLRLSFTAGGALALGGLIVYGFGLAAYSVSRRRNNE